jgi:uncharacterized membrane protein
MKNLTEIVLYPVSFPFAVVLIAVIILAFLFKYKNNKIRFFYLLDSFGKVLEQAYFSLNFATCATGSTTLFSASAKFSLKISIARFTSFCLKSS